MQTYETIHEIFTATNIDEHRIIRALNRAIENDRQTLQIQNMAHDEVDNEILSDQMEMQRLLMDFIYHRQHGAG